MSVALQCDTLTIIIKQNVVKDIDFEVVKRALLAFLLRQFVPIAYECSATVRVHSIAMILRV